MGVRAQRIHVCKLRNNRAVSCFAGKNLVVEHSVCMEQGKGKRVYIVLK